MPATAATGRARQAYVDNLRSLAVLALILFHTARLFDAEAWHMKNATTYRAADMLVWFFNPWHMPLLFLLAGMSAVFAMRKRGLGAFVGERFGRLFVPFVVGVVLTVLPQVYLERISPYVPNRQSPIDFDGSFFAFVPRFFAFVPYPEGDFSWHHLWFIIYLFVYSILLSPLLLWMARSPLPAKAGDWLARGVIPLLLFLPLAVFELALRGAYPGTLAFVDDWANHANFIAIILLGGLMAASPILAESAARLRRPALITGIVLMLIWLARPEWAAEVLAAAFRPAGSVLGAAAEWLWIVALVGYSRVYLDRPVPYLSAFAPYAFPFYIFHQAVIITLGWLTFGWTGLPLVKYLVIAVASLLISYGLARLFDLTPMTRWLIGMKSRSGRKGPPLSRGSGPHSSADSSVPARM